MRSWIVLVLVTGCYRGASPPPSTTVHNSAKPVALAASTDELAYLPADAEVVVGIDLVRLRQSDLYRAFEPQLVEMLGPRLEKFQTCGIDPVRGVTNVTIAGKRPDAHTTGVMVVRGVSGQRALSCLEKGAAPNVQVTNDGGFATLRMTDELTLVATVIGPSTLVLEMGPTATRQSLERVLLSGAPLRSSRVFMSLYTRRERGAGLWLMTNAQAAFVADLRAMGINPRTFDGTLTATDKLTGNFRLAFATDAEASSFVQMATPLLGTVQSMLERVELRADGPLAELEIIASEGQLRVVAGVLGYAMP